MTTKIYLAGGFKSNWHSIVEDELNNFEVILFNPKEHHLDKIPEYTIWDNYYIEKADIIFAYMEESNPSGYGLAYEIGYAKGLGKKVILVDKKSKDDKSDNFSRYFALIRESSDIVFSNLNDGINFLKNLVKY